MLSNKINVLNLWCVTYTEIIVLANSIILKKSSKFFSFLFITGKKIFHIDNFSSNHTHKTTWNSSNTILVRKYFYFFLLCTYFYILRQFENCMLWINVERKKIFKVQYRKFKNRSLFFIFIFKWNSHVFLTLFFDIIFYMINISIMRFFAYDSLKVKLKSENGALKYLLDSKDLIVAY